jgi:hypothetical protein
MVADSCCIARRAPAAAQTATGRLPLGTPRPSVGQAHSHIQVVPHQDSNPSNLDGRARDDGTPTYCSQSLQFHAPLIENRRGSAISESSTSTPGTTFADMARGYTKKDLDGLERATPDTVPLTNFVRLQPSRSRKGNKTWRPLQPSGNGGAEIEFEAGASSSPSAITDSGKLLCSPSPLTTIIHPAASLFDPPAAQTDGDAGESTNDKPASLKDASGSSGRTDTPVDVVEKYRRVFGKLADYIRLAEQTGEFDGQVVFIGHPNRDVGAYQWDSPSFEWKILGTWCHSRSMMEGQVASNRSVQTSHSHHSVEYFKLAAEEFEDNVKRFGRSVEKSDPEEPPFLSEADRMASLSTVSGPSTEGSPAWTRVDRSRQTPNQRLSAYPTSRNIIKNQLEDPFVTPAKPPPPAIPTSLNLRGACVGLSGSMDFGYEFPATANPASVPFASRKTNAYLDHQLAYIQQKREQYDQVQPDDCSSEIEAQTKLREVGFGEEAASVFSTPAVRMNKNGIQVPSSPEEINDRQQLKNRLTVLGDQARPLSQSERKVALPDYPMLNANIRALFPPGPTVANPYRGVSTLNANAAPFPRVATAPVTLDDSQSEETATNPPAAAPFGSSDPDAVRQTRTREISNGFGQQAPTRQNLNGPFFAESMPTANDPTAALSSRISEQERLVNWFRDGQRPIRQQEYAKSLIATDSTSNKGRNVGVIGEGALKAGNQSEYENTAFFAYVLENLADYAMESRKGIRSSYFTRAWKQPHPSMCDPSPEGNSSFFETESVSAVLMQRAQADHKSTPQDMFRVGGRLTPGGPTSRWG